MPTVIVSDLHLGARNRMDLLGAPSIRARLRDTLAGADRVVLLGDLVELRQGPGREALARARPALEDLGSAMREAEVVLVPGNHDYGLIGPWLEARSWHDAPPELGLEQRLSPGEASPWAEAVADALGARMSVAYPGVWLRDDVYATHGHYLDCHATVPTFERMTAALMARVVRPLPEGRLGSDDYEALLGPVYVWMQAVTERGGGRFGVESIRAWRLLSGDGHQPLRGRALARAFPVGVAVLNRLGVGPLSSDLSREQIRRAGVLGMAEVVGRLGLTSGHVLFGHTHRAGPFPHDAPAAWRAGGVHLANSGCWVYEETFMGTVGSASPFWPGACLILEDAGPPALRRLLDDLSPAELASIVRDARAQARAQPGPPGSC